MCLPCTCVFCPAVYNLLFVSLFIINYPPFSTFSVYVISIHPFITHLYSVSISILLSLVSLLRVSICLLVYQSIFVSKGGP